MDTAPIGPDLGTAPNYRGEFGNNYYLKFNYLKWCKFIRTNRLLKK